MSVNLQSLLKPELFTTVIAIVEDAVKFVENNAAGTSEEKKATAIGIANNAYKVADMVFDFPAIVDSAVYALIPVLIDTTVSLYNQTGLFKKA